MVVLAAGMALSMMPGPIIGVLSRFFIDDLGLTRTELGVVATFHAFVLMTSTLPLGSLADRISGRATLAFMLAFVFLGLAGMSFVGSLWWLLVFAGVAAIPAGGSNSATNKIIVENVPAGSRGWITGIKQSGVQLGVFAAGAVLPGAAGLLGWRRALTLFALMAVAGIAATLATVPSVHDRGTRAARLPRTSRPGMPADVWWLAAYGVTMGVGVSTYHAFVPLYAQEKIGMSVGLAGAVIAVSGAAGVVARILWGRIAERAGDPAMPLIWIGALSMGAIGSTWAASNDTAALVWTGAVLMSAGAGSWMSVGMLAAITLSGPERTGRATAAIMMGFGLGLTVGPVLFGWGVDSSGGYDLPWAGVVGNCAASVALMLMWRASGRRASGRPIVREG